MKVAMVTKFELGSATRKEENNGEERMVDGPYKRNTDHISAIFYCMKVNSVRDQQKIDHISEKTIYPKTI